LTKPECNLAERTPAPALQQFARILPPELVLQIVGSPSIHQAFEWQDTRRGYVLSADRFLGLLP
jgi:hypothetical protein